MDKISEVSRTLKAAREAKGLSQRALASMAGIPQSHISKIESAGVDLRISSLTQIARALGLELTLVPRKTLPAVRSIMRSAELDTSRKVSSAMAKELGSLERYAHKIVQQQSGLREAAQLQSRVQDLMRLDMPEAYLAEVENLNKQLRLVAREPDNLKRLLASLDVVQALRNALALSLSEQPRQISRSAYGLEDDDG